MTVVANDLDKSSVEAIRANAEANGVSDKIEVSHSDAVLYMLGHRNKFDVVDVDPYGACAPFLEAAAVSLKEGGLLCVTSTDSAALCGSHPEACFSRCARRARGGGGGTGALAHGGGSVCRRYGSFPVRCKPCHEMGLRILLSALEAAANKCRKCAFPSRELRPVAPRPQAGQGGGRRAILTSPSPHLPTSPRPAWWPG